MITEDYVSFEIAELLKDKGFDEPTTGTYYRDGTFEYLCLNTWNSKFITPISAPTLQTVMKWLREIHNIHFLFDPYLDENYNIKYSIIIVFGNNIVNPIYKTDGDFTYEQACEAAIKYCLENLI